MITMIGDRIKSIRKKNGLSLEQFGERVGVSKSGMSKIERAENGTTDQTIKSICREFGVNEHWLRTGEGEMLDASNPSILARLAEEYHLSPRKQAVISAFLELDDTAQDAIMRYVDLVVEKLTDPNVVSESEARAVAQAMDYEALRDKEKEAATALSTTGA